MRYIKHTVLEGDTVQSLAQYYLSDSSRWLEIVLLNNLEHPFLSYSVRTEGSSQNVKYFGESVLIPLDNQNSLDGLIGSELEAHYNRLLGEDISLFGTDSVELTTPSQGELTANTRGDLATVKGIENLKQAIIRRLSTPIGGLLHHPEYGSRINDMVGKKNTFENQQKIKVELERTIRGDNRVQDISIDSFLIDGESLYVTFSIQAVGLEEIINMGISLDREGVIEWA